MRGYYKDPAATAATFTPDGWLRSGDLGHRDADGFFFVTGRIKELIIKGGENIAPREIDEVLLAHPAVLEAARPACPTATMARTSSPASCCARPCLHRAGAARLLRRAARRLQDAEGDPLRQRAAARPSGKVQRLKLLDPPAA
jgi:non-ribosomal peptide synthetase component E (peptide arylation enzyme)